MRFETENSAFLKLRFKDAVSPKSGDQSNEMALTICNCFRQMRDWKVENLANGKELSTVQFGTEKEDYLCR